MNSTHLNIISNELKLGLPQGEVRSVDGCRGGSFMWKVTTDKAKYAIKQLAPSIDLQSEKIITKYELSEKIAYRFKQQGIEAVSAIEKSGKHLIIIENVGYLVYPWIDGYTLGRNEISETHALKVAHVIAKLHNINLNVPEMKPPGLDIHSSDIIVDAINKAVSFKCVFADSLKANQNLILSMYDNYLAVTPLLLEDTLITHGDLDQLNILWDKKEHPILIDWESVRRMNPTREIIRACLSWSGVSTKDSSLSIYSNMLHTYIKSGGCLNLNHVNAALYSLVGSAVNWILYNINIACTSNIPKEINTATEEINSSVTSINKAKILIPKLVKISVGI